MSVKFEPLRWLLHPVALLAFAAAAQAWVNGADVRAIITAVLGVLIAAATETARTKVTPDAKIAGGGERGQGAVQLLLIVFLGLLCVLVLLAVLGRL